jgi:hypothetical protein
VRTPRIAPRGAQKQRAQEGIATTSFPCFAGRRAHHDRLRHQQSRAASHMKRLSRLTALTNSVTLIDRQPARSAGRVRFIRTITVPSWLGWGRRWRTPV